LLFYFSGVFAEERVVEFSATSSSSITDSPSKSKLGPDDSFLADVISAETSIAAT
jgi:hypothetical protein